MGTTLDTLRSATGFVGQWVVAIQGCSYLLTDGDPDAAVAAWDGTGWFTARTGLRIAPQFRQRIEPFSDRLDVQGLTFSVVPDAEDRFGIDTHRKEGGAESLLEQSINAVQTTMQVTSNAAFSTPVNVQVGVETMAATSKSGTTQLNVTARGLWSPFRADSETLQRFAQPHTVRPLDDDRTVGLKPEVTEVPRNWIGRWVGVWLHRRTGTTLDSRAEAQLVWAGKIVDVHDDALSGETVVECEDARAAVRDAVILRDQWTGVVDEGLDIPAGRWIEVEQGYVDQDGDPFDQGTHRLTFVDAPSDDSEAAAGRYSARQLAARLNAWLIARVASSDLVGDWSAVIGTTDAGSRFQLRSKIALVGASVQNTVTLRVSHESLLHFLGFSPGTTEVTKTRHFGIAVTIESNGAPFRILPGQVGNLVLTLGRQRGTWVNNLTWFPLPVLAQTDFTGDWGIIDIAGSLVLGKRTDANTIAGLTSLSLTEALGGRLFTLDEHGITIDDDNREEFTVRQVVLLGGFGFQEAVTHLFAATGTTDYNHASFDKLPAQLGAAIPWELLGDGFVESLLALEEGTTPKPVTLLIDRPTKLWDLIKADLMLRRASLIWDGGLRIATLGTPTALAAVHSLPESRKASANPDDPQGTPTRTTNEFLTNVIKIEYNRALDGSYRDFVTVKDAASVEQYGEHARTIECRNAYGMGSIANVEEYIALLVGQLLPVFARPVITMRSPVSQQLYLGLRPGDVMTVSDQFPRDPETGKRGVSGLPATVYAHSWAFGDESSEMLGEVEFYFSDLLRYGAYSPAAELDPDANSDGFTAGYNEGTETIRCLPRAHTGVAFGDPVDASFFAVGDAIVVVEIDPDDPDQPLFWERTVLGRSGNDLEVGSLDDFDPTKLYRVISRNYADAISQQQIDVYQAGPDGTVQQTRAPYRYALESLPGITVVASPQSLPERHADILHGDGAPMTPAQHRAIARAANNLAAYKTAAQGGLMRRDEISAQSADAVGGPGWQLVLMWPVFVGPSRSSTDTSRTLRVAPYFKMIDAGDDAQLRVTLSNLPPFGASRLDVSFVGVARHAEFTTDSTSYVIPTAQQIPLPNTLDGQLWLSVEVKENTRLRGLAEFWCGPYATPLVNFATPCRNGVTVQGLVQPRAVESLNRTAQRLKKPLFVFAHNLRDLPHGSGSTVTTCHWHGHTGVGTKRIRAIVVLALDSHDNATDPQAQILLANADGDVIATETIHYGQSSIGAEDVPSEFGYFEVTFEADPDTTYAGALVLLDFARLVSFLVYEVGDPQTPLVSAGGYAANAPIMAEQVEDAAVLATRMLQRNGAVWLHWSTDDEDNNPTTIADDTYRNILDGSSAYAADSAGWVVERSHHNTRSRAGVPVRFAVLAQREDGISAAVPHVRLVDDTGELLVLDGIGNEPAWHVVDGFIPAGRSKIDVQAQRDGSGSVTIHAVAVYELEGVEIPAPPPSGEAIFDADDEWIVPEGVEEITVEARGGGGGSGGGVSDPQMGAGGGAYSRSVVAVSPSDTVSVAVGAGGVSSAGGDSYAEIDETVVVLAKGGAGGFGQTAGGAAAEGIGDVKFSGGNGGSWGLDGGGGGGGSSASASANGGNGGVGVAGEGGAGGSGGTVSGGGSGGNGGMGSVFSPPSEGTAGQAGSFPGGGGGGKGRTNSTHHAGAPGAGGRVRITWGDQQP